MPLTFHKRHILVTDEDSMKGVLWQNGAGGADCCEALVGFVVVFCGVGPFQMRLQRQNSHVHLRFCQCNFVPGQSIRLTHNMVPWCNG